MRDEDGDLWGDVAPPVGVTPGSDCDDQFGTTAPGAAPQDDPALCMKDADGDGWG
ncbi:MAG: hypothetical protein GWN45_02965, partial [Gammaproteobacteria bacterium]|nr:hypothetical protein [Gammaproteobacteria bacterium]